MSFDIKKKSVDVFCEDPKILQPNDLAVLGGAGKPTKIFLSGQGFEDDTVAGKSGDLWTCEKGKATQFDPQILAKADIHRTNGIETSPDGKTLYLSSAANKGGKVVSNKIFRFAIDNSGNLVKEAPKLFHDFTDSPDVDVDGMRSDTKGNLFVTRNGGKKVVKLSPKAEVLQEINFPSMQGTSSLEFGGPEGKTLFVVGKCTADEKSEGCAGKIETDSVGKAFDSFH